MAAGQFTLTNKAIQDIGNTIDWVADGIAAVLVDVAHTPAITELVYSDISTDETNSVTYPDYAQLALTSKSLGKATATEVQYTSDAASFGTTVTIEARYVYFVKGTAGALVAGDALVGYCDFDTTLGAENAKSSNSVFSIGPSAEGWFKRVRGA